MPSTHRKRSPVQLIPDPEEVRSRMAELARERSLLKALYRLAKRKQASQQGGPTHAA